MADDEKPPWCGLTLAELKQLPHECLKVRDPVTNMTLGLSAASSGRRDVLQWLDQDDLADVETERGPNGETASLCAATCGRLSTLQWLHEKHKSTSSHRNAEGSSAIILAALGGHQHVVDWLLKESPKRASERDNMGYTALHVAAMCNWEKVIESIVRFDRSVIHKPNINGETPVLVAARFGWYDLVKRLLIEFGASVDDCDSEGTSVLLHASKAGKKSMVKWLLQVGGATIFQQDRAGNTCFGFFEKVDWLVKIASGLPSVQVLSRRRLYIINDSVHVDSVSPARLLGLSTRPASDGMAAANITVGSVNLNEVHYNVVNLPGNPTTYATFPMVARDSNNSGLLLLVARLCGDVEPYEQMLSGLKANCSWVATRFSRCGGEDVTGQQPKLVAGQEAKKPTIILAVLHENENEGDAKDKALGLLAVLKEQFEASIQFSPRPILLHRGRGADRHNKAKLCDHLLHSHRISQSHEHNLPFLAPFGVQEIIHNLPKLRAQHEAWPFLSRVEFHKWLSVAVFPGFAHHARIVDWILWSLHAAGEVMWLPEADIICLDQQYVFSEVFNKLSRCKADPLITETKLLGLFGATQSKCIIELLLGLKVALRVEDKQTGKRLGLLVPGLLRRERSMGAWDSAPHNCMLGLRLWYCEDGAGLPAHLFFFIQRALCEKFVARLPDLCQNSFFYMDESENVLVMGFMSEGCESSGRQAHGQHALDVWVQDIGGPRRGVHVDMQQEESARRRCNAALLRAADLVLDTRKAVCPRNKPEHLALSVEGLRQPDAKPQNVAAFSVRDLAWLSPDVAMSPSHPSLQQPEKVANLTGQNPTRILIVRANTLSQEFVFVDVRKMASEHGQSTFRGREYRSSRGSIYRIQLKAQALNTDEEQRLIEELTPDPSLVIIESIGHPTRAALKRKIASFCPDIIHFIGHGQRRRSASSSSMRPRAYQIRNKPNLSPRRPTARSQEDNAGDDSTSSGLDGGGRSRLDSGCDNGDQTSISTEDSVAVGGDGAESTNPQQDPLRKQLSEESGGGYLLLVKNERKAKAHDGDLNVDYFSANDCADMLNELMAKNPNFRLRAVVFNCCESADIADTIHERVGGGKVVAIGCNEDLCDLMGVDFACEFYRLAFAREPLNECFDQAVAKAIEQQQQREEEMHDVDGKTHSPPGLPYHLAADHDGQRSMQLIEQPACVELEMKDMRVQEEQRAQRRGLLRRQERVGGEEVDCLGAAIMSC